MRTIYVSAEVKIWVETEMEVDDSLSDGEITDVANKLIKDIAKEKAFDREQLCVNIDEMWDMETNENIEERYSLEDFDSAMESIGDRDF
jgi:hypothetical protein